jgi:hypothetical protein
MTSQLTAVYSFQGRMQLDANDEAFADAVRQAAALAPNAAIDWSDSWSDRDIQEFTAAAARSVKAEVAEDSG